MRGYLREALTHSTFDYFPVYDRWFGSPWAVPPIETIFDEESELEQGGNIFTDNDTYFALTQLVCLQHLSFQFSVVNADKHLF